MGQGDFVYMPGGAPSGGFDLIIGGNTSGTTANVSTGTFRLAGGNNITLSQNGNSITISGPNTVAQGTLSYFSPPYPGSPSAASSLGQSSLYMFPMRLGANLSATQARFEISVSVSTSSNSSWAGTVSFDLGVYTRNVSTFSLLTSGNTNYQFTDTGGASTGSLSGLRVVSVPLTLNLTPGDYWVGFLSQTNTVNANWFTAFNVMLTNLSLVGSFMSAVNSTANSVVGMGHLNSATAAMPASIAIGAVIGTAARDGQVTPIWFVNHTQ